MCANLNIFEGPPLSVASFSRTCASTGLALVFGHTAPDNAVQQCKAARLFGVPFRGRMSPFRAHRPPPAAWLSRRTSPHGPAPCPPPLLASPPSSAQSVLSAYHFPGTHTLTCAQAIVAILCLLAMRAWKLTDFPTFDPALALRLTPLSLIYIAKIVTSMVALGSVNVPMFTALRQLTVIFVIAEEFLFLGGACVLACAIRDFHYWGSAEMAIRISDIGWREGREACLLIVRAEVPCSMR